MSDRSPFPAGVPHLLDQYKQRRQAWLDQADELTRLRDQVRQAAEREALDIVTAARRDVRRIVVEARRELLVLTAQLHASVEVADQAALQAGGPLAEPGVFTRQLDTMGGIEALGATREAVLGARREVRNVLDEARAEIEALAAEARTPLPELATSLPSSPAEPPIPTLETILGVDARPADAPRTAAEPIDLHVVASLPSEQQQPLERTPARFAAALGETPITAQLAAVPAQRPATPENDAAPASDTPPSFVLAHDADAILGGFPKRASDDRPASLPALSCRSGAAG